MRAQKRSGRGLVCASALTGVTALAGLAVAGPAAAQETGEIRGTEDAQAVENSYIVAFEDNAVSTQAVGSTARALAAEYGGQVQHTYDSVLGGFSVRMTEQQARQLSTESKVAYVEQDSMARALGTQKDPTWGLDRIDQSKLPLEGTYTYPDSAGSGVTAYVIDTGVRTTHNEFGKRASSGYDFVDDDKKANDCAGHGTHVAGTIGGKTYGVAKQAKLVGVRVLGCDGTGPWSDVIAGIDWTAENAQGPAVANMSLGGSPSNSVDDAVRGLVQSGVTLALAAGNAGEDACNTSPARVAEAITVGASNDKDERSTWPQSPSASNWGKCLDIFAPGTAIKSAWSGSDTATNTINGTSMASPHVAGAAALHLAAHPDATPQQVGDALVGNATSGALTDIKSGSPNELLNTSYLVGKSAQGTATTG